MITQIRMYTINRGQMDEFLKHFKDVVLPLHEKVGLPVVATYVNRPQNEFIWVRTFTDAADRDAKLVYPPNQRGDHPLPFLDIVRPPDSRVDLWKQRTRLDRDGGDDVRVRFLQSRHVRVEL